MAGTNGFLSIAGNKLESYKTCANDAINFKLVRSEGDVADDSLIFKPDMSHQIFGESENIFGYKDLRIDIYCTAARMITYVGVKYTDKITPDRCDGVPPDDIMKLLSEKLQPGFLTNIDRFVSSLTKDIGFKPFGEFIHSYSKTKENKIHQFEIFQTDITAPGFLEYHERLQLFLLFYVDAASYIDVDDTRWIYYLIYEKYKTSEGNTMYAFAGYMTVYNYYAYPDRIRPRISQMLIMPPFQHQGHGATLIQAFYRICYSRPEILDVTVEDPSEGFQRVRDFVDAKNCLELESFQPESLRQGFSELMLKEAREKLKLSKKQTRHIYEILRLRVTDCFDPVQYKAYKVDIKKRLNLPFQKNGRDFEKLCRALNPNELAAALNVVPEEQRLEFLEKQFQECVNDYRQILNRLELGH